MADIIDINFFEEAPDLSDFSQAQLIAYLKSVNHQLALLGESEPDDMDSEAYETWGDRHETLENLADEIQDRLDEVGDGNG